VADWNYIGNDVLGSQTDEYPRVPLIGNGDIFSYTDYIEHVEGNEGLCKTAMLARGALIKPWLPTEIKERRHWDISASERLDLLKDFVKFGLEHWGSDQQGVNNTRRFLLEFLSFLYRYIPVGLLERVPQQMNERPPKYIVSYNPQDSQSVSVLNLVLPRPS
jgi:tRNA-dihydrouridine synthase 3